MRLGTTIRFFLISAASIGCLALGPNEAGAQRIGNDLAQRLTETQERAYVLYLRARAQHDRELDVYWEAVDERRDTRRKLRSDRKAFSPDDFIHVQPPAYRGPPMPPDVAKIIAQTRQPEAPSDPIPVLSEFLAHAKKEYGFVPQTTNEAEFKRRYAEDALALGLTKDQVVRVYALETGGRGTFDMQAGIDPESKRGTAISTALGYAQLLAANSIDELVKHGENFVQRLNAMAARAGPGSRRASELKSKIIALRRMIRAARSVPNQWSRHVALAKLPKGLGIHALNLDGDIGPWLQTVKLKGLREFAERAGRPNLNGAEIELMNLAGPRTGLDMMEPVARQTPTTNFFARAAYYRNPIVNDKSAADLLKALDRRMDENLSKAGSIAFAKAFDVAMAQSGRSRAAGR